MSEQRVKTEFHLHTAETSPCGQVPGAEIIRALADKGYGGAIVTDHYLSWMFEGRDARTHSLKGFHAAREAGERLGVTVLPGMEFRFDSADNDFLIYGMEERDFASLPDNLWDYTLPDFTAYCHDQGWAGLSGAPLSLLVHAAKPRVPGRRGGVQRQHPPGQQQRKGAGLCEKAQPPDDRGRRRAPVCRRARSKRAGAALAAFPQGNSAIPAREAPAVGAQIHE